MRKRKYPKNRKSYIPKDSQKYRLLHTYPLEFIEQVWIEKGMYGAGEFFNVSPKVIYYLVELYGWKRPLPEHLAKAVKNGCWTVGKHHFIVNEM